MGQQETFEEIVGKRPVGAMDWQWRRYGPWIMLSLKSAQGDRNYPFTPSQAVRIARAIAENQTRTFEPRAQRCGWGLRYTDRVCFFTAAGMLSRTELALSEAQRERFARGLADALTPPGQP